MHPDNIPYPPEWDLPEVPDWAWQAAEKEISDEFDRLAKNLVWLDEFINDYADYEKDCYELRRIYIDKNLEDQITKELDE